MHRTFYYNGFIFAAEKVQRWLDLSENIDEFSEIWSSLAPSIPIPPCFNDAGLSSTGNR